ncbi:unnamed protein product [Closterium sp. Naga37s-1]|nr:unnamed protein product [Closterium sp. Naga37s-1]
MQPIRVGEEIGGKTRSQSCFGQFSEAQQNPLAATPSAFPPQCHGRQSSGCRCSPTPPTSSVLAATPITSPNIRSAEGGAGEVTEEGNSCSHGNCSRGITREVDGRAGGDSCWCAAYGAGGRNLGLAGDEELTTGGGELTTCGGELTTGGGELTTGGGELTTCGGELTTGGGS